MNPAGRGRGRNDMDRQIGYDVSGGQVGQWEAGMRRAFMLGAAALVASCGFAQDAFAQRGRYPEAGFRTAPPGYVGRAKLRVVVPGLRCAGRPRLCYYPHSDLPYVPVGTPPFFLAGHAGKIDSCWGWDGYRWLNFCAGYYPGY
jgi:hypothetical protein